MRVSVSPVPAMVIGVMTNKADRPAGWGTSSIYEVLHRPLYIGEVRWNQTKRRAPDGSATFVRRPESHSCLIDR